MRGKQFYGDRKAVKKSVSGICLILFPALQITGCSQTADQDKAAQKTERAQRTEKGGAGAEESNAEAKRNDSGTGETGREQSAGNSQADAETATGRGDSVIELKSDISIKEGVVVPDFTGKLMDDTSITPPELQGKPVTINFWAIWCGPCAKEMPTFERLRDNLGGKIGIIAVSCGDDIGMARDLMGENGYTFLVVLDEEYFVPMLYPAGSIPYTVMLDAEGKVIHISIKVLGADTMYKRYKKAFGV